MARAVINTEFPSAGETANVLGVSRANTLRLIDLAKRTVSSSRNDRSRARTHGKKAASKRARKSGHRSQVCIPKCAVR